MILGKNWKYILADRLESDVDLRREEGFGFGGLQICWTSRVWGCSMVRGEWKHGIRGCPRNVRGCPRMSAGFLEELPLVRGCPRDSHLVTLKGTDLVRACPRGVKIAMAASVLSALVRAVWKLVNLVCPRTCGRFSGFHSITIPLKVSFPQRHLCGAAPRFTLDGEKKRLKKHTEGGNVKKSKLACQNLRNSYNWLIH